jgi:phasin
MSETIKTQVGEKAQAAAPESFSNTLDTKKTPEAVDFSVPESVRSLAETVVAQNREMYERTRGGMEDAIDALESSFDRAGQGTAALNRKVIDIAQNNFNSGFDLAKDLAGAETLPQLIEIQAAFMRRQFDQMNSQADEIRELATKVTNETSEPVKSHLTRSFEAVRVAS